MTTRVIALDLDGTLLTPKKTLLPSSIEALARAREAGYRLIIVTGRHHVAIHPFYQALALDTPAICCNGTYLYDYHAKTVLEADPMPVNKALQLASLHQSGITLVLVLNRFDEIPEFVQFAGVLADCTLAETGAKEELLQQALVAQLAHSELLEGVQMPEPDEPSARHALPANEPRIVLNNGVVSYNERPILNNLSWQVNPGEHWQIVGPNGAGKSTLLSLITGDHPQGYSNDLTLFGRRRGSGETIWDIKKHIGYVSSSLHLDYRVSTTVRNVILSGYFDSIGIYQAVSDRQQKLVQQWLDILGIDKRTADAPFHSLSWGQQRLALIVRALVKHPTLLILDEPLQGLDPLNRQLIRRFVDVLISEGETQLLFVSHHAEDAPACITHRLEFVPDGGLYRYVLTKIN